MRARQEAATWVRWGWRRLVSMRTAVALLVLLASASVPGSLLPQRGVASNPTAVTTFYSEHPVLAPWLDRLSLFDVYGAPWFAAVYLLLLVSMTGCVLPRCARLWREVHAPPVPGPRVLAREQAHLRGRVADVREAINKAEVHLRLHGFRVEKVGEEVRAEKGQVRELGNLAFHLSLLVLLVGVAAGRLLGYEGRVALVEGSTFANVASAYDELTPAPLADLDELEPLDLTLTRFTARFETRGPRTGEPRAFEADLTYRGDDDSGRVTVRPNQPLDVDGTKFFLTGHGYAPRLTVRDGNGDVAASGATIFLPKDQTFASDGVVKAPDARPTSLAFRGLFLPTGVTAPNGASASAFPGLANPVVQLAAFTGDLGLDDGSPQSVFTLDLTGLRKVRGDDGSTWRATLTPGQTVQLPRGLGSVRFDGVSPFANFQVARDPGKKISLVAAILLLVGLTTSLGVRRRRVWVQPGDDGTVELASRSLSRRAPPAGELPDLATAIGLSPAGVGPREERR